MWELVDDDARRLINALWSASGSRYRYRPTRSVAAG